MRCKLRFVVVARLLFVGVGLIGAGAEAAPINRAISGHVAMPSATSVTPGALALFLATGQCLGSPMPMG